MTPLTIKAPGILAPVGMMRALTVYVAVAAAVASERECVDSEGAVRVPIGWAHSCRHVKAQGLCAHPEASSACPKSCDPRCSRPVPVAEASPRSRVLAAKKKSKKKKKKKKAEPPNSSASPPGPSRRTNTC